MPAGFKAIVLTLFLAVSVYLAGNARVQLWDRDEPRYAECSRQMLQSGDWVVPRLYDKLRFQKPPLIYWCQASAMKLFGREGDAGAFSARLPSTLAVLCTLVLLATALTRHAGVAQAKWTVFVFATSAMTIVAAKSCLTDGVLIFFVTAAQLCCYAIWRGNRSWSVAMLLGIVFGLGILTKGPFILGIVASTAVALGAFRLAGKLLKKGAKQQVLSPGRILRERAGVRVFSSDLPGKPSPQPSPGVPGEGVGQHHAEGHPEPLERPNFGLARSVLMIALALAIIGAIVWPWIHLVQHRAPDFLPAMLHEGKQHTLEGKEGHHFPPGFHFVAVWAFFMPWSLLLPLAIGAGIRNRNIPEIRFALAAILGPWLMVEFMGTKLPHYFLPAYPAMAFLVAFAIRRCLNGESKGIENKPFLIGAGVWAMAVAILGALPWLAVGPIHFGQFGNIGASFRPLPWHVMIGLTILGLILGLAVFLMYCRRKFKPAFITMGLGMLAFLALTLIGYFPNAEYLRISIHAADELRRVGATHSGDVKMIDYKEPSLAFYQGGTIREVEKKADLIYKPLNQWPHWVVITREAWDMTPADTRARLRVINTFRGWAYADKGRVVEVMVVENTVY